MRRVYQLKDIKDFDGNYTAFSAGATAAGGGSVTTMRNQNGVTVELVSTTQGAKLTLGPSGVRIKAYREDLMLREQFDE